MGHTLSEKRLSVLHVNDASTWRGGERQTLLLALGLARHGVRSIVAAPPQSPLLVEADAKGLETAPIHMRGELDALAAIKLRTVVHSKAVDIVHAHTAHAHGLAALSLLGARTVSLVVTRRVQKPIEKNILSRMKYGCADRIVAISNAVRRTLITDGISEKRLALIPSGIDRSKYQPISPPPDIRMLFDIPKDACIVGTVAAMSSEKDYPTLLRAARQVAAKNATVHFVLIGDGPERRALMQLAEQLGITSRLVFTGPRADAELLLAGFDIFVLASRSEGLGSSVLDAMAANVPAIAANTGGIPDMITHGVTGLLFEPGNNEELAERMLQLLESESYRSKLAAQASTKVDEFDVHRMISATAHLYHTLRLERAG